jgi:hypothetical protein
MSTPINKATLLNVAINLDWFLGFFEAEGNFFFSVRTTNPIDVRIAFKVTQANKELLQKIQNFFGFGLIQSEGSRSSLEICKFNVEGAKNVALYATFNNVALNTSFSKSSFKR